MDQELGRVPSEPGSQGSAPQPATPSSSIGADPSRIGPRVNERLIHEIGGGEWTMCVGCPKFRVFDFHYYYCRHLGDQEKPDKWGWERGWFRLWHSTNYKPSEIAPCKLPTVRDSDTH